MERRQDHARARKVIAVHFIGRVAFSPPAIRRVLGRLSAQHFLAATDQRVRRPHLLEARQERLCPPGVIANGSGVRWTTRLVEARFDLRVPR